MRRQSRLARATPARRSLEAPESTFPTSFIVLKEKLSKAGTSDMKHNKAVNSVVGCATGLSRMMGWAASRARAQGG